MTSIVRRLPAHTVSGGIPEPLGLAIADRLVRTDLIVQINNDGVLDFGECYAGNAAEQVLLLKNTLDVPMVRCVLVDSC